MKLILVRHGDALTKDVDPKRSLSERGIADVKRVGEHLQKAGVRVPEIQHSGKRRAEQTAEILASFVGTGEAPVMVPGLSPNDPPEILAETLAGRSEDLLWASHLPLVARLASHLLTPSSGGVSLAFSAGAAACLERGPDGRWSLLWFVSPTLRW
ncbi:MAG: phosphohistidine phosphatase SixA [Planctomycetota bacterium]|jgi:phosphohistidine phosphatase